jgi:hypothetical protein
LHSGSDFNLGSDECLQFPTVAQFEIKLPLSHAEVNDLSGRDIAGTVVGTIPVVASGVDKTLPLD